MLDNNTKYKISLIISSFKEIDIPAILEIKEDNCKYITFDIELNNRMKDVYNFLIESSDFFVAYCEIDNIKLSFFDCYIYRQKTQSFIIKSDILCLGKNHCDSLNSIKTVQFSISNFRIGKINEKIISQNKIESLNAELTYKQYSDYLIINFEEIYNLDQIIEIISSTANFFSLLNNSPSEISNIYVINKSDDKYQIHINWLQKTSLKKETILESNVFDLLKLSSQLNIWFSLSKKCQIAMEQFFAMQRMEKKYYAQIVLSTEIFAFEGFLNAYNEMNTINTRYISENQNKKILKKIIDNIEETITNELGKDLSVSYIKSVKELLGNAFRFSFSDRLLDFFGRHSDLFIIDFKNMNINIGDFVTNIKNFRNAYAHNSDKSLKNISKIDYYCYSEIIVKAVRILLLNDLLGIKIF